ncbi:recombinase family protein [Brevibacterium casei]|nr:recombinase family protein [Brevibacterium casei]
MIARQVGVLARYESEHKSERITRAHRQGAELGKYRGGSARIFGYNDDGYTLNAVEAEAIRGAYQAILEGKSAGSILRDWKARGLTSTQGRPFIHTTLRGVLLRKRNYGVSEYKGRDRRRRPVGAHRRRGHLQTGRGHPQRPRSDQEQVEPGQIPHVRAVAVREVRTVGDDGLLHRVPEGREGQVLPAAGHACRTSSGSTRPTLLWPNSSSHA